MWSKHSSCQQDQYKQPVLVPSSELLLVSLLQPSVRQLGCSILWSLWEERLFLRWQRPSRRLRAQNNPWAHLVSTARCCSLTICSKHWLSLETVLKAGLSWSCQWMKGLSTEGESPAAQGRSINMIIFPLQNSLYLAVNPSNCCNRALILY